MLRSIVGIVFTFTLSVPNVIYKDKVEDKLLKDRFGKEWKDYAEKVGFLFPRFRE